MKRVVMVMSATLLLFWTAPAEASDPTGGYVLVERVVFEPSEGAPQRVQVWGVFALCKEARGYNYTPPMLGYVYYTTAPGKEETCRKEWADFKRVAGTGQVVGFGSSYKPQTLGRVRKANEKAETPDTYPLGTGQTPFASETEYAPVRGLLTCPIPVSPGDGDLVPPGKTTLSVRNIAAKDHPKAAYVFEFEAGGTKEVSPAIPAGAKETSWTPTRAVKPGEKCTWRVKAVDGTWTGTTVTATFLAKG